MELQGKCVAVLPQQSGVSKSGKNWVKVECVIETQEQYPKKMCFTLFGDEKVKLCPKVGDEVLVKFDINAREYQGRWYNEINAWAVEVKGGQQTTQQPTAQPQQGQPAPQAQSEQQQASGSDELPF